MLFSICIGYIFDMFGRKYTIFISFIIAALLLIALPFTAPDIFPWLLIVKIGLDMTVTAPLAQPFVTDYVKVDSRGRATGY
jgi:MFS family permease